jgi:hypothetical protein
MELDRQRTGAVVQLSLTALWLALGSLSFGRYPETPWVPWVWLAGGIVSIVDGWRRLRAARRALRAFEAEHGADAGVQKPV